MNEDRRANNGNTTQPSRPQFLAALRRIATAIIVAPATFAVRMLLGDGAFANMMFIAVGVGLCCHGTGVRSIGFYGLTLAGSVVMSSYPLFCLSLTTTLHAVRHYMAFRDSEYRFVPLEKVTEAVGLGRIPISDLANNDSATLEYLLQSAKTLSGITKGRSIHFLEPQNDDGSRIASVCVAYSHYARSCVFLPWRVAEVTGIRCFVILHELHHLFVDGVTIQGKAKSAGFFQLAALMVLAGDNVWLLLLIALLATVQYLSFRWFVRADDAESALWIELTADYFAIRHASPSWFGNADSRRCARLLSGISLDKRYHSDDEAAEITRKREEVLDRWISDVKNGRIPDKGIIPTGSTSRLSTFIDVFLTTITIAIAIALGALSGEPSLWGMALAGAMLVCAYGAAEAIRDIEEEFASRIEVQCGIKEGKEDIDELFEAVFDDSKRREEWLSYRYRRLQNAGFQGSASVEDNDPTSVLLGRCQFSSLVDGAMFEPGEAHLGIQKHPPAVFVHHEKHVPHETLSRLEYNVGFGRIIVVLKSGAHLDLGLHVPVELRPIVSSVSSACIMRTLNGQGFTHFFLPLRTVNESDTNVRSRSLAVSLYMMGYLLSIVSEGRTGPIWRAIARLVKVFRLRMSCH